MWSQGKRIIKDTGSLFVMERWGLPWVRSVLRPWGTQRDFSCLGRWAAAEEGTRRPLRPLVQHTSSATALVLLLCRGDVRAAITYDNLWGDGLKLLMERSLHAYLKSACAKPDQLTWFDIQFLQLPLLTTDPTLMWHCLALRIRNSVCGDEQISSNHILL